MRFQRDISLTGFDNLVISSYADRKLTTVERSIVQIGTMGMNMLLTCVEEGIRPGEVWLNQKPKQLVNGSKPTTQIAK